MSSEPNDNDHDLQEAPGPVLFYAEAVSAAGALADTAAQLRRIPSVQGDRE